MGVEEQQAGQAGQIQKMMDALVALPLAIEMGHFVPGLPCFKQPSCMFTVHAKAVATIGLALYLAELSRYSAFLETSPCDLSWAIRIHLVGAYSGEKWQGRINEGSLCGTWWEDWWSASHVRAGFLPA